MADFETPILEIVLEPERNEFAEWYFFSKASSKSKKDTQVIWD